MRYRDGVTTSSALSTSPGIFPTPQGAFDFLLSPARNPLNLLTKSFYRPMTRNGFVALAVCLSYLPYIRFVFTSERSPGLSALQGLPQIVLIVMTVAAMVIFSVKLQPRAIFALGAAMSMSLSQLIGLVNSPATQKNLIMPAIFPLLMGTGVFISALAAKTHPALRVKYIAIITKCVLGLMTFECLSRLLSSPFINTQLNLDKYGVATIDDDWFYKFKQSILYSDGNSVGIALLCLIAILLIYRRAFRDRHLILAYFLILATFSRASIIAAVVQYTIYRLWRWRRWIVGALAFTSPFILYRLILWYANTDSQVLLSVDGSFLTKLLILQRMTEIYSSLDTVQRFFGIGSGNTEYLAGMAAHNILVVLVLELGIIGSVLLAVYFWIFTRKSPSTVYLLIAPILVNGFSLFLTTVPFLYVTLAILTLEGTPGQLGSSAASKVDRNGVVR